MRNVSDEKNSIQNDTNSIRSQISRNLLYAKSCGLIMTALTLLSNSAKAYRTSHSNRAS